MIQTDARIIEAEFSRALLPDKDNNPSLLLCSFVSLITSKASSFRSIISTVKLPWTPFDAVAVMLVMPLLFETNALSPIS